MNYTGKHNDPHPPHIDSWTGSRILRAGLAGAAAVLVANSVQTDVNKYVHDDDASVSNNAINPVDWLAAPIGKALIDSGLYHSDPTTTTLPKTSHDTFNQTGVIQEYYAVIEPSDDQKTGN